MNRAPVPIKMHVRDEPFQGVHRTSSDDMSVDASTGDPLERPCVSQVASRRVLRSGRMMNHPILVTGVYLLAVGVLVWSLVFRLGGMTAELAVEARMATSRPLPALGEEALSLETVERIRARLSDARDYLVADQDALTALAAELEKFGWKHGWRTTVTMRPPLTDSLPMVEAWRFPLDVRLAQEPSERLGAPSGYQRLLDFLEDMRSIAKKVELDSIEIRADQHGVLAADFQLVAWTKASHEKSISK